jgi:putative solute:sodium symporter small subunit
MSRQIRQDYWRQTCRLTVFLLSVWFVLTLLVVYFARELSVRLFGWPLSFYLAAQGLQLVFLLIVHQYASRQARRDQRFGLNDDLS